MLKKQKQLQGFTLMEILISMSIFVIFTLAILSIHSFTLRASQKTLAANRIQGEAQLIMESLAKKIRTSRVNYDYSGYAGGIGSYEEELSVVDLSDTEYVFFLEDDSLKVKIKESGAVEYNDAYAIPTVIVSIDVLKFIIQPTTFPFDIDTPPETQPRVTIVATFSSTRAGQTASLTVQQTIPQLSGGIVD
ncbi:MAG: prepilin-type N-terminal cleavage/methylation domain-containing protein [Patescibacteria group bacterium]